MIKTNYTNRSYKGQNGVIKMDRNSGSADPISLNEISHLLKSSRGNCYFSPDHHFKQELMSSWHLRYCVPQNNSWYYGIVRAFTFLPLHQVLFICALGGRSDPAPVCQLPCISGRLSLSVGLSSSSVCVSNCVVCLSVCSCLVVLVFVCTSV